MVRRIVEEDVAAPSTTVVEGDGSWIGRTIVALVVITLLVVGAIWLVRAVSNDNNGNGNGVPDVNVSANVDTNNNTNDSPAPVQS